MTSPQAPRRSYPVEIALGLWSIVKGLGVTLQNALRPRVTRVYPAKPTPIHPRFRGRLVHKRGEDGRPNCTACLACMKVCPTLAIRDITGDEGKGKDKRVKTYVWDAGRCLFCNLCVEACPFNAIKLSEKFSTVGESREQTSFCLEELLEPAEGEKPE